MPPRTRTARTVTVRAVRGEAAGIRGECPGGGLAGGWFVGARSRASDLRQ
ncbi:hypothetical protein GCM10010518_35650 [Kitasatospora cinereorecta]